MNKIGNDYSSRYMESYSYSQSRRVGITQLQGAIKNIYSKSTTHSERPSSGEREPQSRQPERITWQKVLRRAPVTREYIKTKSTMYLSKSVLK